MRNYKLSTKAEGDISDINTYGIHKFGLHQAKVYIKALHNIADKLIYFRETWFPSFYFKWSLFDILALKFCFRANYDSEYGES